jgi:hypothetical protein
MTHFTVQEWVDFVRGKAGKEQKAAMQTHLETGCKRCKREATTWQRVREAAGRQIAVDPDDSVIRFVKGSFTISGNRRSKQSRGFLAELLFDSSREPVPVGVRTSAGSPRQMLFGAGDLRIDLRLEPQIDSESVFLVGQILDAADPGRGPATASVALLKAGKVVAEAKTNRFGEFQLSCDLSARLELRVKLPLRKEISIFLVHPISSYGESALEFVDSKEVTKILGSLKSTRKKV